MRVHRTIPPSLTQPRLNAAGSTAARRYRWARAQRARAYRNGELICDHVDLLIAADTRLGLAPRERRQLIARFVERLAPTFRHELEQLVRRRGAAATRIGDRMETIELVFDDSQRLVGRLEPPQARRWDLAENEFVIREHTPPRRA